MFFRAVTQITLVSHFNSNIYYKCVTVCIFLVNCGLTILHLPKTRLHRLGIVASHPPHCHGDDQRKLSAIFQTPSPVFVVTEKHVTSLRLVGTNLSLICH